MIFKKIIFVFILNLFNVQAIPFPENSNCGDNSDGKRCLKDGGKKSVPFFMDKHFY